MTDTAATFTLCWSGPFSHWQRAKSGQNTGLRRRLFQTGTRTLAEASPLDTIRGIGFDEATARETRPDLWPGRNLLGRFLTEVREELWLEVPSRTSSVEHEAAA